MNRTRRSPWGRTTQRLLVALSLALSIPAIAQLPAEGEFTYYAKPRDTLIGLSRRILLQPRLWPQIQERNHIPDPYRIIPGTAIRIPYSWLRLSAETASVFRTEGTVSSAGQPVRQGQTLPQGSAVETGEDGSVAIDLPDGSRLTLQKSSTLQLQEMQHVQGVPEAHDVRLRLGGGHLETNVKPHRDVGRFEIVTPTAVMAVRGTTFRANSAPVEQTVTTETLEGTVGVSAQTGAVEVQAGFGTRVEKGSPPLPPVPLLPAPDLSAVPNTNLQHTLQIAIGTLAGARAYHVQISTGQDFRTLVADIESAQPTLTVPGLADGTYWLRARGIDQLGLEGRDAIKSIVQHVLPDPPAPTDPAEQARVIGPQTRFTWSTDSPGARYRLQLASDPEFTDLIREQGGIGTAGLNIDGLTPGRYFWRVASVTTSGEAGAWSDVRSFTQRPAAPRPVLESLGRHDLRFAWQVSSGEKYRVQISRDAVFKHIMTDRIVDAGKLSWRRPWPGRYYIRVQTVSLEGVSDPPGERQPFEVPFPLWVRITVPAAVASIPFLF